MRKWSRYRKWLTVNLVWPEGSSEQRGGESEEKYIGAWETRARTLHCFCLFGASTFIPLIDVLNISSGWYKLYSVWNYIAEALSAADKGDVILYKFSEFERRMYLALFVSDLWSV